jgi:predicted O-methyltransferase YrrM
MKRLSAIGIGIRNVILGGNLISLRHIFDPKRVLFYVGENLFAYRTFFRNGLPPKNIYEVFPARPSEQVSLAFLENAWFHSIPSYTADIVSLCLLARLSKPKVIFEIGTLAGYTAVHFALNAPEARIFTLDLGPEDRSSLPTTVMDDSFISKHEHRPKALEQFPQVTCLYGDTAKFDFSPYRGLVDLFFIDGAHSYEYVRNDSLKAMECTHPGSVIAWHDYGRYGVNGVSRWLEEFATDRQICRIPGGSLAFMRR